MPGPEGMPGVLAESSPARSANFFTIRATSLPDNRPVWTCPCRFRDLNSGPAVMPACSIRDCTRELGTSRGSIRTGFVFLPRVRRGMALHRIPDQAQYASMIEARKFNHQRPGLTVLNKLP